MIMDLLHARSITKIAKTCYCVVPASCDLTSKERTILQQEKTNYHEDESV